MNRDPVYGASIRVDPYGDYECASENTFQYNLK
jgi:hypothetical protein